MSTHLHTATGEFRVGAKLSLALSLAVAMLA